MYGDNFLVETHQEVTAANQGKSYIKVVFPPGNAPKSANKGCGWLLGGGVSQEAGYDSKCNRRRDYKNEFTQESSCHSFHTYDSVFP